MTADVNAASVRATLAVSSSVSDETAYNITKALFENLPELGDAHAKGKEISLDAALSGISVPLHPGAAKYFKEKGLNIE